MRVSLSVSVSATILPRERGRDWGQAAILVQTEKSKRQKTRISPQDNRDNRLVRILAGGRAGSMSMSSSNSQGYYSKVRVIKVFVLLYIRTYLLFNVSFYFLAIC